MNVDAKSVLKKFEKTVSAWRDVYNPAREDLSFMSDDPSAQWDEADYQARIAAKRPVITVNILNQFINQVANNVRMNTPTINVIPSDSNANDDTAEVIKGLIKHIEYKSNADDAYDTGVLNAIRCSIGFIRVNHVWADKEQTIQELTIGRVVNPLAVYIDPNSVQPDGSDAKFAFVLDKISVSDFKEKYDGKDPVSFEVDCETKEYGDEDEIQICEYFYIDKEGIVRRELRSGADVLEETTFPGDYIPIVPVYGEECWENGKRKIQSLIRNAKVPQQMYNYWKSMEVELLQKQPRAKWVVVNGALQGFEEDWIDQDSVDVLSYNPKDADGNPAPAPQMIAPPQIPTGIVNAQRQCVDDIKSAMGIYNAALGEQSNETSGIAIQARKVEAQVTTYHFGDNLVRSITQVGRILVSALGIVYDTARVLKIVGEDNQVKSIGINGEQIDGKSFNLTDGKYDVRVTTGAAFTTLRQESAALLKDLLTQRPDLTNIIGDIAFENMDIPGAKAIAKRLKKTIAPEILDENNQDPQVAAMQNQLAQAQQIIQTMKAQMVEMEKSQQVSVMEAQANISLEQEKVNNDRDKLKVEIMKIEAERAKSQAEFALKQQELDMKKLEIGFKNEVEQDKLELEQEKLISEVMARVHAELKGIGMPQSLGNEANATMELE